MLDDLAQSLKEHGTASLEVTKERSLRSCRNTLISAAKAIDVRISIKRMVEHDPPFERVVARVLSPEEAERQVDRDNIFRAVNDLREIAEEVKDDDTSDDLNDIANELEDYARKISGGARGDSPFNPDAAPAPSESTQ